MYNIEKIRKDFPILSQKIYNKPLVYLDNAATTQKPQVMIDALVEYYSKYNSNVHRGVHFLSQKATDEYERTRGTVQKLISAKHAHEIIYTSGTTDSINLISSIIGKGALKPGDEIIVSGLEHHSNIVPWQFICDENDAHLKVIPVMDNGMLDMNVFHELLSERTKLVAVNHISNAIGTVNPVEEIIEAAHKKNAWVLIDGAQSIPHMQVDVTKLDCDFYTFSAHKIYGPTGIGILYGKEDILNALPPYRGGGEMISEVTFEKTTYAELPHKLEAGTPNIADMIAFNASLEYVMDIGIENIAQWEHDLLSYATEQISGIEGIEIYGDLNNKAGALSFNIKNVHPYDIGTLLDKMGIAVRTGHHCAQPVMSKLGIPGTVRASFAMYNTKEEIDQFVLALKKAHSMLV